MVTIPISKASADQRAGRAGRTQPGKAFRLYTREFFESSQMPKHSVPDLQLVKLTPTILQLLAIHVKNVMEFDFLSPLPVRNVRFALEELNRLGALNPLTGALTDPFGKQMAQLPLEPELAHFFLRASVDFKCPREAAALAAMFTIQNSQNANDHQFFLSGDNYLKYQRRFWVEEGDHMTLLSVFMSFLAHADTSVKFCQKFGLNLKILNLAHRLYKNLLAYLGKVFGKPTERSGKLSIEEISVNLRKSLVSAYPLNVSKSDEPRACYLSLTSQNQSQQQLQFIHPMSVLFKRLPPLILYGSQVETTRKFLKFVTIIEADWLEEVHPKLYKQRRK
jgi:ATP-dependent RNA helicase DDX35